jgi:hypothetical protein
LIALAGTAALVIVMILFYGTERRNEPSGRSLDRQRAQKEAMTPEEYRERSEHYGRAKVTASDNFTRRFLAAMEQSYRVLADSEEAFEKLQNQPMVWTDRSPTGRRGEA